MQQTLAGERSQPLWRFVIVLALCLGWANGAVAITSEAATALCKAEMLSELEAVSLRDLKVRRHDDATYVYGNADFSDINGIHFRCKICHDKVRAVRYLVRDPEYVNGRAWARERPHGVEHEGLELDELALSAPPPDPASPHFVRVP